SARPCRDPHKKPTTIPCRGNPAHGHCGAATAHWALRLRGRDRARGYAGDRWRAVWYEGGRRRQCEAVAEDKLAAKLAKVAERLAADAPGLERPGADLIAWYLNPDRHPAGRAWSRKHADTQRRLCERFAAPVIGGITCQDIRLADMQR